MLSRSKLMLAVGIIAAALVTLTPPSGGVSLAASPTPAPALSQADQLRAQRAQLVQQLSAATGARDQAKSALVAAQGQLSGIQKQLSDTRSQLDGINSELTKLSQQISADEQVLVGARAQLGALIRVAYETSDKDGFAGAVLSANDFGQAMDRIRSAQDITDRVIELHTQIATKEKSLLDERTALQTQGAEATQLEAQLNEQSGRLMALVGQRDATFQSLTGPARDLASRIASIDDQLAPPPPPAPAFTSTGTCGNHFAFGYCTYYVATRRCIPWLGNAWDWWAAAAQAGYAEGQSPARGAVVVWGRSGSSPVGHVAYVEAVGPDGGVPDGSFLISEMNYRGWDQVNYRTVRIGSPGILGFIYGHN